MNLIPLFEQGDARDALKKRCRECKVPIATLEALVQAALEQVGKRSRRGLWEQFDELLSPAASSDPNRE